MPNSNNFYPSITDLFSADQLPVDLGDFGQNVQGMLSNIFYKDYQFSKSHKGESASYSLTLLTYTPVGIEIPGTGGLSILLNPTYSIGSGIASELPLSLSYKLEILKYISAFDKNSFSGDPSAFFNLFLDILNISPDEFLTEILNIFYTSLNPIQDFVRRKLQRELR